MDSTEVLPLSAVIMQPTTLCNLDCRYCYLPLRHQNLRMLPMVARAVARSIEPWTHQRAIEICWHGGEPLTAGREHLGRLMDQFAGTNVVHGLQTNATLIDEAWCDFLAERDVHVGVSIDGPPDDNAQRRDRSGRQTFDSTVRGIRMLRHRGHKVSAIAVVSNPSVQRARSLYDFVAELGCTWLGVNIEEREGANRRITAPPLRQVIDFWSALVEAWHRDRRVRLRDAERALHYASAVLAGRGHAGNRRWTRCRPWHGTVP